MAQKKPREVAGLGRPETPLEKNDRVQKARQERRARQTTRNLVWSLLTTLGVVALLIIVVVRPDTNLVEDIDWQAVAEESASSLPADPLSPRLSSQWGSNRAEIVKEPGADIVWSIGLLGPENSYVSFDQGFGADATWVAGKVEQSPSTGSVELGYGVTTLEWVEYDRTVADEGANNAYVLVLEQEGFVLVVAGTSKRAVGQITDDITFQLTQP